MDFRGLNSYIIYLDHFSVSCQVLEIRLPSLKYSATRSHFERLVHVTVWDVNIPLTEL